MKFKALAGLGNPGKYEGTYHNVGIDFVRRFADLHEKSGIFSGKNFQAEKSGSLFCIFPSTFMNESGEAIRQAVKHLDISSEELLIAHDDSDLPVGKYRFSFGRGAAGHHGVESVISHLKTKDFWRLRIGIRPEQPAGRPRLKAGDFVLKKIRPADLEEFQKVFASVGEIIERFMRNETP